MLERARRDGMLCAIYIPELGAIPADDSPKAAELRRVVDYPSRYL